MRPSASSRRARGDFAASSSPDMPFGESSKDGYKLQVREIPRRPGDNPDERRVQVEMVVPRNKAVTASSPVKGRGYQRELSPSITPSFQFDDLYPPVDMEPLSATPSFSQQDSNLFTIDEGTRRNNRQVNFRPREPVPSTAPERPSRGRQRVENQMDSLQSDLLHWGEEYLSKKDRQQPAPDVRNKLESWGDQFIEEKAKRQPSEKVKQKLESWGYDYFEKPKERKKNDVDEIKEKLKGLKVAKDLKGLGSDYIASKQSSSESDAKNATSILDDLKVALEHSQESVEAFSDHFSGERLAGIRRELRDVRQANDKLTDLIQHLPSDLELSKQSAARDEYAISKAFGMLDQQVERLMLFLATPGVNQKSAASLTRRELEHIRRYIDIAEAEGEQLFDTRINSLRGELKSAEKSLQKLVQGLRNHRY